MGGTTAVEPDLAPAADDGERRRPWRALLILLALAALLAWGAFVTVSLLTARTELTAARQLVQDGRSALLDADAVAAHRDLGAAGEAFGSAERRLSGLALLPLRVIPPVRSNLLAATALAGAGARTAAAGEGVAGALTGLPGGTRALVPRAGTLPLEPLEELAPALHRADALLGEAQGLAASVPDRGLVAPLADARAEFLPALDQAASAVSTAVTLVDVLPGFLGADGPRRYFLGASSPAELRGTGGLIGAYAVLTVDAGQLDIGGFSPVQDMPTLDPSELAAPNPDYAARYDRFGGAGHWLNLNMTPDFPSAATAIRTLYEAVTGEQLDGAIVVDPHMLSGLLALTGPAEVPGGGTVDADTVVAYVANKAYGEITDPEQRKGLLGAVAAGALEEFLRGDFGGSPLAVIGVLGDALSGGNLLLNAADPDIQAAFEQVGVAGRLLDPEGDFLAAVVNNAANNKIDFYAERTVHYQVELHDDGSASATAAVELANDAPTVGDVAYVIGPIVEGAEAGDNRSLLSVYCASDCARTGYRRSLGNDDVREETELGHPVFTTMVRLGSGEAERIELDWELADAWQRRGDEGVYRLTVQDQPTIRPTRLVVDVTLPAGVTLSSASDGFEWGDRWARWDGNAARTTEFEVVFRQ